MAEEAHKDFFISYNKADKSWAEWIAWQLEDSGYTVKIQAWDFLSGSNFVLEMDKAAKIANRTLAVLSPHFLAAPFPQPEWAAAFRQDPTGEKGKLWPVRVRECHPEGLLGAIVYTDLVGLDETAAREALLQGARLERAKPQTAPIFPGERAVPARPRFPGALPAIWHVPHGCNPNFTGREELLADLRAALAAGETAALVQPQAIHGLGGVGKTALAVEYAYRYAPEYGLIWWVKAEEAATLAADYAELASELDLPQKANPDQGVVVQAVRAWLRQHPGWLLVFDNAGEPTDLTPYFTGGAGHVLITSRNPAWGAVARPLEVRVLPRDRATAFLLKRTGQKDEDAAQSLAQALGDLPLALEQAGAYMEETGTPLAAYLQLFQQRRLQLWGEEKPPTDYHATVAATWSLALENIKKEAPAAADLLNLCAFLGPEDIPASLMEEGGEYLPESLKPLAADPLVWNRALGALRRYSLIERGEDSLSMHHLVQAVVRDCLKEEGKKTWAGAAVGLVNASFPGDIPTNPASWPVCSRLLPHALEAAGHAGALQVAPEEAGRLLNQTGLYLQSRAEFAGAKSCFARALAIDEGAYGPNHPRVAIRVNNLGSVLRALGDLAGARSHYERALAIREKLYGMVHPEVATCVNNLGAVFQDLGDLAGARSHYERALAMSEEAYSPKHPWVGNIFNNLGAVLRDLGDLAGARSHFERALTIHEAAYGPQHPAVATDVNNLGAVLQGLGDLEGAWSHYERALAIDEAAYGPQHPKVAIRVNNLGAVLRDLGDLEGARSHFERALAIDEAAYGADHPDVATDANNLGLVLHDLGDLAGARAHYERALKVFREFLGEDHPHTILVRDNLNSLPKA